MNITLRYILLKKIEWFRNTVRIVLSNINSEKKKSLYIRKILSNTRITNKKPLKLTNLTTQSNIFNIPTPYPNNFTNSSNHNHFPPQTSNSHKSKLTHTPNTNRYLTPSIYSTHSEKITRNKGRIISKMKLKLKNLIAAGKQSSCK